MDKQKLAVLVHGIEAALQNRSSLLVDEVEALESALRILQKGDFDSRSLTEKSQLTKVAHALLKVLGKIKLVEMIQTALEESS